jgi:hypothetical protein
MINRHQTPIVLNDRTQTIMQFGKAKLIQTAEGKLEMKGATKDEQTEAKEFISLFMHESVLSFGE